MNQFRTAEATQSISWSFHAQSVKGLPAGTFSVRLTELREEARRIFRNYSLDSRDYEEAVDRYVYLALEKPDAWDGELSDSIQEVLYSMELEDVYRRPSPILYNGKE